MRPFLLPALCGLLLFVLAAPGRAVDNKPPKITITQPTSASTYVTSATQVTLAGTASDPGGSVTSVTWSTNQGGSGPAQGTTTWSVTLALPVGTTQITMRAFDAAGNQGQDVLTVTVMAQPGPITLQWDCTETCPGNGDAFEIQRCTGSTPETCGTMATVASVAIGDRSWVDQNVAPTVDYCYHVATATGGTVSPYTPTVCSP